MRRGIRFFGKLREIAHMGEEDLTIQNMKKGLLS